MMTCGVPQGSVLGPVLWNVFYDDVLNTRMPEGTYVFGYADDTAIVVTAKNKDRLVNNANTALCWLSRKIRKKKLKLAAEKTEALILYGGSGLKSVEVEVDGLKIHTKATLKYLGVTFDHNLRMTEHIKTCCTKSERTIMALSRLMPNAKGPRATARRTLASVVHSIILYAVPIWFRALQHKKYRLMISKVQRRMALRICSAFKTVPTEAALVISNLPPIDILAQKKIQQHKCLEWEINVQEQWQKDWNKNTGKACWTKILISNLETWCCRGHGQVDYYLTQFLSGHGWFESYQKRFHNQGLGTCTLCQVEDTAEHTFFECQEWKELRTALHHKVDRVINPHNVIEIMLDSQKNWENVANMARTIMKAKEDQIRLQLRI